MPEHTPAPQPARAVYGFALFLLFKTLFVLYVIWAYVPRKFLEETLGLTYLPDKYFAQSLPIVIIFGLWLFAFSIYPMMGFSKTAEIDSIDTIRDEYTMRLCEYKDAAGRCCKGTVDPNPVSAYYFERFCPKHINHKEASPENGPIADQLTTDFCDCPVDESCLIRTKSDYLEQMRLRKRVPAAYDLDIADVCKKLYGN